MKNAVYIGRFQPLHDGHMHVITTAFESGFDNVLVLVGSAFKPRTIKNPFTYAEREEMILSSFRGTEYDGRVVVRPLRDNYNETLWLADVNILAESFGCEYLLGSEKDSTSYYLKCFPHLSTEYCGTLPMALDATDIRDLYFRGKLRLAAGAMTPIVRKFLEDFSSSSHYADLRAEFEFIAKYKSSWAAAPYAPTFVTVDAVVVQSGHVLLVERGANPGKGLLALPGGFINHNERIADAVLRELREETEISVPDIQLRRTIVAEKVFDDPNRSLRGRTITHAFLFRLDDSKPLPKVVGADDAKSAAWIRIKDLKSDMIYEDHFDIIHEMIRHAN